MDAHGIDRAWLHGRNRSPRRTTTTPGPRPRHKVLGDAQVAIPFASVMEAVRRYPDRFIPGYCPHPLDPRAADKLEAAIDIHGVKVCGEWKFCLPIDDPRCIELFRRAGQRGVPVVIHLDVPYLPPKGGKYVGHYRWKGGTIDNLERALVACPDTNFIRHAPGFGGSCRVKRTLGLKFI